MACSVSEELTAYLDGELDFGGRAKVEAHVATCAECSADLALLRGLPAQLGQLPAIEPSAQLRRDVLNALPERKPGWSAWRWLVPASGLAAVAAAALIVIHARQPKVDEVALAQNLEVVQDLGALQTADLSDEDLEVVANLDALERKE